MGSQKQRALKALVLANSVARDWSSASAEWVMVDVLDDARAAESCLCGQANLRYLYTIANPRTQRRLFPIGSECINHFDNALLAAESSSLRGLAKLRELIVSGETIELTSTYFSRAMLVQLGSWGTYPASKFNRGDGSRDAQFMIDMFNKQARGTLTKPQERKVWALLRYAIIPHVLQDDRIRTAQSVRGDEPSR